MKTQSVLLQIENLSQSFSVKSKWFSLKKETVKANDHISLSIYEGETFGLVGESGCGKSTLGRTILQLYAQQEGKTVFYGRNVEEFAPRYLKQTYQSLLRFIRKENSPNDINLEDLGEKEYNELVQAVGGLVCTKKIYELSTLLLLRWRMMRFVNFNCGGKSRSYRKKKEWIGIKINKINEKIEKIRKECEGKACYNELEVKKITGIDLTRLTSREMRKLRCDMQMVFQDPYSALNPRMTVAQIIGEGLDAHGIQNKRKQKSQAILRVMEQCGLSDYMMGRYPYQFSGGQRQRIGIARSLILEPKFLVCDEAVSALDVSIQSQILNLLQDLKETKKLTYLFISHDMGVIRYISDRIGVMYLGSMMEIAPTETLFEDTKHPYTRALLEAIPSTWKLRERKSVMLEGEIPSAIHTPRGCKFHPRCLYCTEICKKEPPPLEEIKEGHYVACYHKIGENIKELSEQPEVDTESWHDLNG